MFLESAVAGIKANASLYAEVGTRVSAQQSASGDRAEHAVVTWPRIEAVIVLPLLLPMVPRGSYSTANMTAIWFAISEEQFV
jgi:hypothetical protein